MCDTRSLARNVCDTLSKHLQGMQFSKTRGHSFLKIATRQKTRHHHHHHVMVMVMVMLMVMVMVMVSCFFAGCNFQKTMPPDF